MASFVFLAAVAGTLLVAANLAVFVPFDELLLGTGIAGAGGRMFGATIGSDHSSPF